MARVVLNVCFNGVRCEFPLDLLDSGFTNYQASSITTDFENRLDTE